MTSGIPGPLRHGDANRYKARPGAPRYCRCVSCKEAHRQYTAANRRAALKRGTLTHGKSSTFDAGCRCLPCRVAKSEYRGSWGRSA